MGVCCFQLGNIVALSSRKIWDQSRWPMGQWKIDRPIDLYKLNQGRSSQVIKRCWTCFKQKKITLPRYLLSARHVGRWRLFAWKRHMVGQGVLTQRSQLIHVLWQLGRISFFSFCYDLFLLDHRSWCHEDLYGGTFGILSFMMQRDRNPFCFFQFAAVYSLWSIILNTFSFKVVWTQKSKKKTWSTMEWLEYTGSIW